MAHVRQELTLRLAGRFGCRFRLRHLDFDGQSLCYVTSHAIDEIPLLVRAPLQVSVAAVATAVAIDESRDVLLSLNPSHLRMAGSDVIRMDEGEHRLAFEFLGLVAQHFFPGL